ncbi:MAG: hypothetical protein E5X05_01175 [Mesorhizobium sp.]|nr:MAG: hypothetical protein E5X05_01175 [Mesorhizobium sp.]
MGATDQPPLVETKVVHDIFINGVARVDPVGGGVFRITLYADTYCAFDGRKERNIVARLLAHNDTIKTSSAFVAARIVDRKLSAANDNHQAGTF